MKPEICPFTDRCADNPPDKIECEPKWGRPSNYVECKFYAWLAYETTIPLPLTCPLADTCKPKQKCFNNNTLAYRECTQFSRWFWEQIAKERASER
jgi:hypothetical protein